MADGLLKAGYQVSILDNLSTGEKANLPKEGRLHPR